MLGGDEIMKPEHIVGILILSIVIYLVVGITAIVYLTTDMIKRVDKQNPCVYNELYY